MKWCTIKKGYISYLKRFEEKIPNIDYGPEKFKPFLNPLFEKDELIYVTQVSHPQRRHEYIKENVDFIKLFDKTKLIGVVNLNYMFPVPKELIINIEKYSDVSVHRTFETDKEKNDYIALLKKEMKEIQNKRISEKAELLYDRKNNYPEDSVSKRCINFKELEEKALEYKEA
jgi:protein AbiQ